MDAFSTKKHHPMTEPFYPLSRKILGIVLILWPICHMCWALIVPAMPKVYPPEGTVLILGNQVYADSSLSPYLTARMEKGLQVYKLAGARQILVSGGTGREGVNEAVAMANWLVDRGVAPGNVLLDTTGNNTWLTAQHSQELLAPDEFLIVVSHSYHLVRCRMALKRNGFERIHLAPAYSGWTLREILGMLREFPAYYYYVLFHF